MAGHLGDPPGAVAGHLGDPPGGKADGHVDFSWKNHADMPVLRIRPERWVSSDLGQVGGAALPG
ncbi:hypothetical protein ACWCQ0_00075 [Streptomyces massasporeus]